MSLEIREFCLERLHIGIGRHKCAIEGLLTLAFLLQEVISGIALDGDLPRTSAPDTLLCAAVRLHFGHSRPMVLNYWFGTRKKLLNFI